MAAAQPTVYVYIQLPGTVDWVPCASLVVREVGAGLFEGTFTYGRRYLERPDVCKSAWKYDQVSGVIGAQS